MGGNWTDEFSFITGSVRSKDTGYLALIGDDVAEGKIDQSIFVVFHEKKWFTGPDRDWNTAGMTVIREPLLQMVAVSEWGDVLCMGSGDTHDEHVSKKKNVVDDRGPLRGVRLIGSSVYVVGMDRQAYQRRGVKDWIDISPPKPKGRKKDAEPHGFEAVDGFNERDIYAAGWDGAIWRYDGKIWTEMSSGTNLVLVDVCCAGDDNVYACGRMGLLLKGRGDNWQQVETEDFTEDIWSLCWFKDKLYVSTTNGVYTLGKKGLTEVDMGNDAPETCYRLSAADGLLWSIGAKDVMAFDGKRWTRVD